MPSIIHLNIIWEHTLTEILNYDNKTEVGIIMRSWVTHNKLVDMTDLLIDDLNDFTPSVLFVTTKDQPKWKRPKSSLIHL